MDLQKYVVDPSDFEPLKGYKVLIGGCGAVSFSTQKSTGRRCAVKKTQASLIEPDPKRYFTREIEILARCKHPAIVPFIGYAEKNYVGIIYLEMMKCSLLDAIKEGYCGKLDNWNDTTKYIITYGIAAAMSFLHSQNRIHRDLKPGNVLLDDNNYPYVTDFGTAKQINSAIPINQTLAETTPIIMAPEFISEPDKYSNSLPLDVYSFGITIYQLWTGIAPFGKFISIFKILEAVTEGKRPDLPDSLPKHWGDFIGLCWSANIDERPTFLQILEILNNEPFLNDDIDIKKFREYQNHIFPSDSTTKVAETKDDSGSKSDRRGKVVEKPAPKGPPPILIELKNAADKSGDNVIPKMEYATALFHGTYDEHDFKTALEYFIKVASSNDQKMINDIALAEYYAAQCFINNEEYLKAQSLLKRSISHGLADAAFYMAELIFDGKLTAKSKEELNMFYQRAADANNVKAISKFAMMTILGTISGRPNKSVALEYFKKGSDLGDPEMMYMWSIRKEFGRDIEQDIPEGIRLLKLSAELGYYIAQYDYALHLFNGYHVTQDKGLASTYFELAAKQDHPQAQTFYAMMTNDTNPDESNDYLEKARNNNDPDAWALYGQLLAENGQIDDSLSSLYFAMRFGSLTAMISLGHICESDPTKGEAAKYFQHAADHCHFLDEYGFAFPIEFKVVHCDKCNIDTCEGCAKHCHNGHKTREIGKQSGFKCQCGSNGLKGKCSAEISGAQICQQHLYQCITCCFMSDKELICKSCAEKCHIGHKVIDLGVQQNFCSCGLHRLPYNFMCKILNFPLVGKDLDDKCCSSNQFGSEPTKQRWFKCISCGIYGTPERGICESCAKTCHKDHFVIDDGVKEGCCQCINFDKCLFDK